MLFNPGLRLLVSTSLNIGTDPTPKVTGLFSYFHYSVAIKISYDNADGMFFHGGTLADSI